MELGFYNTNLGILYFEGVWLEPTNDSPWEPIDQNTVTLWEELTTLDERCCSWIRKPDDALQLQTSFWWVGYIKQSEPREGLFYWKVALCRNPLHGYADSEHEAVGIIETLIKTDPTYTYKLTKQAEELK